MVASCQGLLKARWKCLKSTPSAATSRIGMKVGRPLVEAVVLHARCRTCSQRNEVMKNSQTRRKEHVVRGGTLPACSAVCIVGLARRKINSVKDSDARPCAQSKHGPVLAHSDFRRPLWRNSSSMLLLLLGRHVCSSLLPGTRVKKVLLDSPVVTLRKGLASVCTHGVSGK